MKKLYKIIGIGAIGFFMAGIFGYYAFAVGNADLPSGNIANSGQTPAVNVGQIQATSSTISLPDNSGIIASSSPGQNVVTATSTKKIVVDLKEQRLTYYDGDVEQGSFLISSGLKSMPTPTGTFYVQIKRPIVHYVGPGYDLPNTKWNLQFLPHYYIHGAYWHNNFGHPMSHGCVNVSYQNMEGLYNWADVGTQIIIHG